MTDKQRDGMEANGSPQPIFKTDEDHRFFLVILSIHPEATQKNSAIDTKTHQLIESSKKEKLPEELKLKLISISKRVKHKELSSMICDLCAWQSLTAQELAGYLGRKDKKHLVRQYLTPLIKDGLLKYAYPKRGSSPNQAYVTQQRLFPTILNSTK